MSLTAKSPFGSEFCVTETAAEIVAAHVSVIDEPKSA